MYSLNWNFGKKKIFKKSVHRNKIKRLLRASFFLNKFILYEKSKNYYIILIYNSHFFPKFINIDISIKKIFNKIKDNYD
ncbi:ribonuclease P protein component [Blattabacterium cuenoti]|uniref:ribonuclease P protein component n=1 Tax=Blattabacterium cuenoti TaxID=1653831 RepID=UPI00163BB6CE